MLLWVTPSTALVAMIAYSSTGFATDNIPYCMCCHGNITRLSPPQETDQATVLGKQYLEGINWVKGKLIGTGAFCSCFLARDMENGIMFAVKQVGDEWMTRFYAGFFLYNFFLGGGGGGGGRMLGVSNFLVFFHGISL